MTLRGAIALALAFCLWRAFQAPMAQAEALPEVRYALIIGANLGASNEVPLRYAVRDAVRVGQALKSVGGFLSENVIVLEQPTADRVRDALRRLNHRIRLEVSAARRSVVLVFFSGHGDHLSLHLGNGRLSWDELREGTVSSSANVRLLFVDACRSGVATRVKGIKPIAPFAMPPDQEGMPEGFVIFSSAAEGEDAQESDALQASFFTHHLISALHGAADVNGDGRIGLSEAYTYTSERTVASTAGSGAGIQHPTYNYELKGRADLTLAAPIDTENASHLRLQRPGRFVIFLGGKDGAVVAEASVTSQPKNLWVEPGRYFVQIREADEIREGHVEAKAGVTVNLTGQGFTRVRNAQLLRKGSGPSRVYGLGLYGGWTRPLLDYGWGPGVKATFSIDLRTVTFDVLGGYNQGTAAEPTGAQTTLRESALRMGARKVFDFGRVSASAGLRLGLGWVHQEFHAAGEQSRARWVPMAAMVARADVMLAESCFASIESELLVSSTATVDSTNETGAHIDVRPMPGAGFGCHW
ncbi:MAG: caspase family protein [Deltaproteobacteria bacterium]|nr:caspase family protein [Deltaproteobacteria bacterium]